MQRPASTTDDFVAAYTAALPRLHRAARSLADDASAAADLLQSASMRMFAKRELFAPGTDFEAWALRVMSNCFIGDYRRRMRRRDLERANFTAGEPFATAASTAPRAVSDLALAEFDDLLAALSAPQRESFELYYAGYSVKEIAERHGVPEGTVKSRLSTARKLLRRAYLARRG